ncbi:restriction endonuclease subunit S [Geomonas terrae]|uniref:Restriction endonuclease subunit S n=1 Tax=Geomonas terrae TaxID=2562681 RepID=A0A4S1C9I6_9BACT|nr:restriction endonuclease subunit S [Geomonas terrae]TGU69928.1 restriction endonuclease subunit S [Geomonas terrae]
MALTKSLKEIIAEDQTGLLSKHETWERVRLGDVAGVLNGFPFESRFFHPSAGMPLIRIRDVLSGSTDTFYTGEFERQFLVNPSELLVGMDGDFNSARWKSSPGLLNQRVCKITPNENFYLGRLLEYALPGFLAAINAATSSVTVKHLSSRSIEEIELPLPPLKEQSRIVEKLDEILSDHDAGVAELKAAQKKLAQYRQSVLKSAFEGELSAAWRMKRPKQVNFQDTGAQLLEKILADRRKRWEEKQLIKFKEQGKVPPKGWQDKYLEPAKQDATNLPILPDNWVWANLGLCFYVGVGATPSRKEPDYWNGEIPWVSSGEVQFSRISSTREHISEKGLKNTSTQVNPKGSVLLGMVGEGKTRGQVSILDIDAANNQNCAAIWVSETGIMPEFVYYWLWSQYDATRRGSSGNNQPALNKSLVEKIAIPIPPLAEIEVIADMIDSALINISDQESAIINSLKQSEVQRKNILKSAFSGKLVPQDPNDEPATVLLERIHAEREGLAKQPKMRKAKVKKEISAAMKKLIEVLGETGDWMLAQDAFRLCGVADVGATTDQIEGLYAELRELDKAKRLMVEVVTDANGRKQYDRLKLAEKV